MATAARMTPNYDYDLEQQQLQARLKLMEAMQSGALQPTETQSFGGQAAPMSWTQPLAKLMQAYVGAKGVQSVNEQQRTLASRYKGDLQTGMQDLINGLSAQPGTPAEVSDESGGHAGPAMSIGDAGKTRTSAILHALSANHPVLQQLGMTMLQQQMKNNLESKDLKDLATPESVLRNPNDPSKWIPKKKITPFGAGEVGVDDAGDFSVPGQPKPPAGAPGVPGVPGTPPAPAKTGSGVPVAKGFTLVDSTPGVDIVREDKSGDLYQRTVTGLKKLDNAPKTTINNATSVVNKGEGAFSAELGKDTAKLVNSAREKSTAAQQLMPKLDKLEQLSDSGVLDGPGAKPGMFIGQLAQSMGIPVDAQKLANSEEYVGQLGSQVASYLTASGGVGRSLTDPDREALMSQFPQLINTPAGRKQIIGLLRNSAQADIHYGKRIEDEIGTQFPELKRVREVAPVNSATYPPGITPGHSGKPVIKNW